MTTAFAQPSPSGTFLKPADLNGHLILVTDVVETFDRYDELAGKDKLNARFSYVDLDGDQQLVTDAINSHPGIALRLKAHAGKGTPVLGRITQEASKKAGFNAAWVLGEFTEGVDDVRASAWLAAHAAKAVAQPAPVAAPTVAAPAPVAPTPAPVAPVAATLQPDQIAAMKAAGIPLPPGVE
jgi:hypothetical protein